MLESELTLDRVGFPPFSARNCKQTLTPVLTGELRRTVNGTLIYTGDQSCHKFQTSIECRDKVCPAFENIWRGSPVKVGCIQRLSQKTAQSRSLTLQRDPVENSVVVMDAHHQEREVASITGRVVTLRNLEEPEAEIYVFYRPSLDMRVVSYKLLTDEWGFYGGWQLDLEEI